MSYDALRKGRVSIPGQVYHVTVTTASRAPWFADFSIARAAVGVLRECAAAEALAWVVMPDHVHWLLRLRDEARLQDVVREFKGRSARQCNRLLGRTGAFWQKAFHDRALRSDEDVVAVARYIVGNPVRAGIVAHINDYPHWDAVWL